jgi:NADH:ubiquinone oxidoreductase subunit E
MDNEDKIMVVVCMGSSCFSRGNSLTLKMLQDYIRDSGIEGRVELKGSLCEDDCKCGPNISINGIRYREASAAACLQHLARHLAGDDCRTPGSLS